jgi:hypothetical protein
LSAGCRVERSSEEEEEEFSFTSRLEETGTALYGVGTGTLWRVDQKYWKT